jgi:exonuclease III
METVTSRHGEIGVTRSECTTCVFFSTANSRANSSWNYDLVEKADDHTRIYVINLNGVSFDRRGGQFDTLCQQLKEIQVDVFCGQEHNLDTTKPHIRSILFHTATQHWERDRIVASTTPIPFHTTYKPGGTMALAVGSLTGRIIKQIRDKWGRWVCQEFRGCGVRKVVIISAYQPVLNNSKTTGKITVVSQQKSLQLQDNDETSHPRTAFRRELSACLASYKRNAVEILLVGNFNEVLGTDPDSMTKITSDHGLIDLMASRHSSIPPATYARGGSKRLDFVCIG